MSELVEFIRGCLDADEQTARAAFASDRDEEGDPNWRAHRQESLIPGHLARWQVVSVAESWEDPGFPAERVAELMIGGGNEEERPTAEFIARHDPARVLAEVNAKRAILDKYERASVAFEQSVNPATSAAVMALAEVVDEMAQCFRGEPGWRDEWGTQ